MLDKDDNFESFFYINYNNNNKIRPFLLDVNVTSENVRLDNVLPSRS